MTVNGLVSAGLLLGGVVVSSPVLTTAGTVTGAVGAIKFFYDKASQSWGRG